MAEGENTSSSFIWAITLIVIVAILAGVFYYSGFMGGGKKDINIKVNTPTTSK